MRHLKRIKVAVEDLQLGMFVGELDKDWSESSFLLQGFTLDSEEDIEAVQKQCKFVYVDFRSDADFTNYRQRVSRSSSYQSKSAKVTPDSFRQTVRPAISRRNRSSKLMKSVMDKIMLGEDFELHTVREVVKDNVKQVLANEDAMLMMTMLKSQSDEAAQHSFNVSILAIGFAKFVGYDGAKLEDIGMAALLHDVGKAKIDKKILGKLGKLNQHEMQEMCRHPQYAYQILMGKAGLTPSCVDVAVAHHERLGGQGYPRALKSEQITPVVRLVSIIDVFEALTSRQPYRKPMSVMEAYKILMAGKGSHFDEKLVLKFIEWRGIYPPGSIVEMENGEVGIVVMANKSHKLKPRVLLVLDEYKQPRVEKIVDLAKMALDGGGKPYKIVHAYENEAFGIELDSFVEKGLKIIPAE